MIAELKAALLKARLKLVKVREGGNRYEEAAAQLDVLVAEWDCLFAVEEQSMDGECMIERLQQ
jgi:hypothetical protein